MFNFLFGKKEHEREPYLYMTYINNALYNLLTEHPEAVYAIDEIRRAVRYGHGEYSDEVRDLLNEFDEKRGGTAPC